MRLGQQEIASFERDGFLVLRGTVPSAAVEALRSRMAELVDAFEPSGVRTVFSTDDQGHAQDRWFLESGGEVRFFFEKDAFDREGRLTRPKERSFNKCGHLLSYTVAARERRREQLTRTVPVSHISGTVCRVRHALHDRDPVFSAFSRRPELTALASGLGLAHPRLVQSMWIFKPPHIGGEVTPHQDSTFLMTEPPSCIGLWFAIDPATAANGCLWALPGGHRLGLKERFVRDGLGTHMEMLDAEPLPVDGYVPLEALPGDVVVLHGLVPHRSGPNTSPQPRAAYTLHLVDGAARWLPDNWLQRDPGDPPRGFDLAAG